MKQNTFTNILDIVTNCIFYPFTKTWNLIFPELKNYSKNDYMYLAASSVASSLPIKKFNNKKKELKYLKKEFEIWFDTSFLPADDEEKIKLFEKFKRSYYNKKLKRKLNRKSKRK